MKLYKKRGVSVYIDKDCGYAVEAPIDVDAKDIFTEQRIKDICNYNEHHVSRFDVKFYSYTVEIYVYVSIVQPNDKETEELDCKHIFTKENDHCFEIKKESSELPFWGHVLMIIMLCGLALDTPDLINKLITWGLLILTLLPLVALLVKHHNS